MNINYIKFLGIILVTVCCLVSTYTDVKYSKIPNYLTFSTSIVGIFLVSFYFILTNKINWFYYLSIVIIFVISYILWLLGVWAGGDVKLFTAISSLFVPEFLNIVPAHRFFGILLPLGLTSFKIPTLLLIFNSILSIIPIILIMVIHRILSNRYNLNRCFNKIDALKELLNSLNSFVFSTIILSNLNIDNLLINLIILFILVKVSKELMKHKKIFYSLSIAIFMYHILTLNLLLYIEEFIVFLFLFLIKKTYKSGVIKDSLTVNVKKEHLKENMILSYPLCLKNGKYFFDESNYFSRMYKPNGKIICDVKASGLSMEDIILIQNIDNIGHIPIKKGLSFAPFILMGLFISLFIGNTYDLLLLFGGIIYGY